MVTFIAKMVMKQRDLSLEKGQAKYRAYFVKTSLYRDYQDDVDTILKTTLRKDGSGENYSDCIVAE